MTRRVVVSISLVFLTLSDGFASTINVPAQQPTIQDGINAAQNGDTVLVAPGTYVENINFKGKSITVTSSGGQQVTIIDGNNLAPVAVFVTNEGPDSTLSGFTLQNGSSTVTYENNGGGIYINSASPTIKGNIIQSNFAGNFGGGIGINSGSPVVEANVIRSNTSSFGGGFFIGGLGSARIIANTVYQNSGESGGGGMNLFDAGTPLIENNFFYLNSGGSQGGGMWIVNDSNPMIVQNLFVENKAGQGGGIYFSVPDSSKGPVLVNNTVIGAAGVTEGSAVWAGGFDRQSQLFNNILVGQPGQNAVWCDNVYSQQPPLLMNNDAWSANGTGLQGTCASESQQNGNISANPRFVNAPKLNFQLQPTSPAINAGDNNVLGLPSTDLAGHSRIVGGIIDMGAYEYQGTEN